MTVRRIAFAIAAPVSALVISIAASSIILLAVGSNPIEAYGDMFNQASKLETQIAILNRATPLYLSGVAAAIGFKMNLFNIGVEGQYLLAALFAAAVGGAVELPTVLHILLIFVVSMTVGALWAGVAATLLVTRRVNIVISTIMLNGIAVGGLIAWLISAWKVDADGVGQIRTERIAESGILPNLTGIVEVFTRDVRQNTELTGMFLVAILVGVGYHTLLTRTRFGFDLRASGMNPVAAEAGGVPPRRMVMIAMLLSGATAGLVGLVDVFEKGFFPSNPVVLLGFAGIGVALLGRNNPAGIAVGALIFAFLDSSSGILQFTGAASPEIVVIMQGVIILAAVISYEVVQRMRNREETAAAAAAMARADS